MRIQTLAAGVLAAALVLPTAQAAAHPSRAPSKAPSKASSSASERAERGATVKPRSDAWEAKVLRLTNARRRAHRVRNPDLHRVGVAGRRDAEGRTDAAQDFIG